MKHVKIVLFLVITPSGKDFGVIGLHIPVPCEEEMFLHIWVSILAQVCWISSV